MESKTIKVNFEKKEVEKEIKKDLGESEQIFQKRVKFILAQKINSEEEFQLAETYSRIWVNVKYRKVTYSDEVMQKLKKFKK
jgi:hypothetical protein